MLETTMPAHPPDLDVAGAEVGVLPGDAVVFLVQADGVRQGDGLAVVVVDHAVQVGDLAEAVAAEFQGVGEQPDAVLALVEHQLAVVHRAGVAVGDEHLAQARAVDDAAAVVADPVQHQALAGGEADPQVPLLPGQVVAVDAEARALVLGDVQWLDVRARAVGEVRDVLRVGDLRRGVVGLLLRHREDAVVLDADDGQRVQVDLGDDAVDRVGVAVVVRVVAHPGERRHEAAVVGADAGLDVRRGPRVDHAQVEVGDAALAHRLLPARVVADDVLGGHELFEHDARLDAGHPLVVDDLAVREPDDALVGGVLGPLPDDDLGEPVRDGAALFEGDDLVLGRLVERDVHEPRGFAEALGRLDGASGGLDLRGGQRGERVRRRRVNSAGRVLGVNKKSHAHSRNAERFVVNVYLLRASDTLPLLLSIAPEAGQSP